ncbi:MAG: helix-turn-helix transcriptional regulator [Pseudomonadota bacterium]
MKTITRTSFASDPFVSAPCDIAQAIKAARTQANLRIVDAALLSGVALQTFVDIEAGSPGVSIGRILQVANAMGVSLLAIPAINRERVRQQIAMAANAK